MAKRKKPGTIRARRTDTTNKKATKADAATRSAAPAQTVRPRVTHRVRRHKPNGSLPESFDPLPKPVNIGEAMRQAVDALGERIIDEHLAPTQMIELGEVYEQVTRAQAAFNARNDDAKTAKKALESTQELLLQKVRSFTHPAPLPLFDRAEREADQQQMLEATAAQATDGAPVS